MKRDRNFLKGLVSRISPSNPMAMILNMAKPFLGDFNTYMENMNKPESEGGQLQEGEQKCYLGLTIVKGEMRIMQLFLKIENGQVIVTRQVYLSNLNELSNDNDGQ